MGTPYVGEIRMFGGNFAPAGWMLCQGQLLAISENETLFNLIGTTYGGDGQSTFGLPNLQSRVPIHQGPGFTLAQAAGEETVTLTLQQIPGHSHAPAANSGNGTQGSPSNGVWAQSTLNQFSITNPPNEAMAPQAILASGGSQPHDNMMPYLVINFIISLFGIFPSQT
jgi:microcystin-dependent protein